MRRTVSLLVLVLTFVVSASAFAEQIVLNNVPPAPTMVNTYRVDFNGSFTPWFMQTIGNRWVWDVIASTDNWAEVDFGPNIVAGDWTIIPMIGADICRDVELGAKCYSAIPQLYLLHYGRLHAETWALGILPFRSADPRAFKLRQIASVQLSQSKFWAGAHYDLESVKNAAPVSWLGPIVEREIMLGATASLSYQWNLADQFDSGGQSRFLMTVLFTK
jgi:hypothetical protein